MELSTTVDLNSLTLDNFQATTGHRFRMTKEQKARAISRAEALAEFITAERAARQAPATVRPTPAAAASTTPAVNAAVPGNPS